YTMTNDILLIGKKKTDMKLAFDRMKEIGGGIVMAHEGEIIYELPLRIEGVMSEEKMNTVIEKEKRFIQMVKEAGYPFEDPVFTLFFLSSTHLPFIRITPEGIIDVKKRDIIVPANMRYVALVLGVNMKKVKISIVLYIVMLVMIACS